MAGTERSGFAAATPDLFRGARWALCLDGDESDCARWLEVAAVITDLGAGAVAAFTVPIGGPLGVVAVWAWAGVVL